MGIRLNPVVRTAHGFFCAACGASLTQEEIDFDTCDVCGGDGLADDGHEYDPEDYWPDDEEPNNG